VIHRAVCLLVLAALLLSGSAQARPTKLGRALGIADNRRQGMLVGMGTGLSFSYARTESGDLVKDATRVGWPTELMLLGYAPNDRLQIYFGGVKVTYLSEFWDKMSDFWDDEDVKTGAKIGATPFLMAWYILVGPGHWMTGGLGCSYYFEGRAPALYLDAGVGIGVVNNPEAIEIPSSRTSGAEPGVTPYVGVGYEFATHASVLGRVMYTHSGETSKGFHNERDALSLVVTFRFISY
jgi:hypothetical protein